MNKKSMELSMHWMIIAIIGITFLVAMIVIVPKFLWKGADEAEDYLGGHEDYDRDGVPNFFDKCPCDLEETENGCPVGVQQDCPTDCPVCESVT